MAILSTTGKLFDCLLSRGNIGKLALRRLFNTIGTPLLQGSTIYACYCATFISGFLGPIIANLSLPLFPEDHRYGPVVTLGLGLAVHELVMTGGFYFSHKELAGRHSGVLFGMTNTMAQIPGFLNPLLIAWLPPGVTAL